MQRSRLTFVHGFMGHPSDWDDIRRRLKRFSTAFETVAIEIASAKNWSLSVANLADRMPSKSILIGYSMGARLSLGVALEFSHRCDGLIFVSGSPGIEALEDRKLRWNSDSIVADKLEREPLEPFLRKWYEQKVFENLSESHRRLEIELKLAHAADSWPAILRTNSVSRQPNYWPRIKELKMPVLVVAGEADGKYRDIALRIKEFSLANVRTEVVPGSGHIVHREQPEVMARLIAEFTQGICETD